MAPQWFRDILPEKTQYITYNNFMSKKEKLICSVPQASILIPLLFSMTINVMVNISYDCLSILSADDTNIFNICTDIEDLHNEMNDDSQAIHVWLNYNLSICWWHRYRSILKQTTASLCD